MYLPTSYVPKHCLRDKGHHWGELHFDCFSATVLGGRRGEQVHCCCRAVALAFSWPALSCKLQTCRLEPGASRPEIWQGSDGSLMTKTVTCPQCLNRLVTWLVGPGGCSTLDLGCRLCLPWGQPADPPSPRGWGEGVQTPVFSRRGFSVFLSLCLPAFLPAVPLGCVGGKGRT